MKICFFDLDNTLLDNRHELIPDSALTGISMLKERGVRVVLATGRDMDTHYSVRYRDIIEPDAIIHQNGTRISVGDKEIFRHFMDRTLLKEIYEFCKDHYISVGTSIGKRDYYLFPKMKERADLSFRKRSIRNFFPFELIFSQDIPVSSLAMAGDMKEVKPLVEKHFPKLMLFPFPGGLGADVTEKGFDKASGLKRVCEYFCEDISDTYAFGDSANDVPMLLLAGKGIAVGGADREAKEAADIVTDNIERDGIYKALKDLGLI